MGSITILIAEDHADVRASLCTLLRREADFAIVGEAEDGLQAVVLAATLLPDVILMDINMPRLNGLQALRRIHETRPGARILVLSAHSDEAYIQQAERFGASGFVSKLADPDRLPGAIRDAHLGKPFFSPGVLC